MIHANHSPATADSQGATALSSKSRTYPNSRRGKASPARRTGPLPCVSPLLVRWFAWYSRRHVARHFFSVRVSRSSQPPARAAGPLVIYTNHASWWDPMVAILLASRFFPGRTSFAPIDAAALQKYKFFQHLGFFPVAQGNHRGAAQFLRGADAVLRHPRHILWITPQGRFADVREPAKFHLGLGHLPALLESGSFVPVAIEYSFWEERLPEIFVRFGPPFEFSGALPRSADARLMTAFFEGALSSTQQVLATEVLSRDKGHFEELFRGQAGVGSVYDWWRRARSAVRGQTFALEHGLR